MSSTVQSNESAAASAETRYDYLIVGGGMAADAAARGIRENDPDGSIGILSSDVDPPYARPALSKKLWTDPEFDWSDAESDTAADTGADIHLGVVVDGLTTEGHTVEASGRAFAYGKLLLATGGQPKSEGFDQHENIILYRTAADYRRLRAIAKRDAHVVVVGGSYIGTEIASALVQNGCRVTLVIAEDVLGGKVFPEGLAHHLQSMFLEQGVQILAHSRVAGARAVDQGVEVELESGEAVAADAAVVGLGITPSTGLAQRAGLRVSDGIVVDEFLRTSATDVYAAGDVANYPDRILGRRRVEHVDNATEMGRAAGRIMSGSNEPYAHTPYYYSVVFGNRYEAVGRLDASLETVEHWPTQNAGVVYYLEGKTPVGVLLWNVEGATDDARRVLASEPPETREELIEALS